MNHPRGPPRPLTLEKMMAAVVYDASQREKAKADDRPLIAFDFDDRHVPREKGGGFGRMTVHAPASMEAAVKLREFVVTMIASGELPER